VSFELARYFYTVLDSFMFFFQFIKHVLFFVLYTNEIGQMAGSVNSQRL